ncbi:MAG: hypothetical protein AB1716_16255 [Planctomycetota bacterium]
MVIHGHCDGERVILDERLPAEVAPNTPVRVVFPAAGANGALQRIADLARPAGLPRDFAAQHAHYIKGTAKR